MFRRKTLPSPPPPDLEAIKDATRAKAAAVESYRESMETAKVATQQGDRMRRIRVVNNIGPSFGAVYERRRHA